ncbi:hypothetical protein EJ04DRAFT_507418 [Polyplosphaeria fusca]|uniref:Uncharacterized protein n=1 Tax=Polyplosphaeria fusca TaxID=682080 RepID=A0A9P4R8J2_9PLEO|nr:hypothetical protein EJ04DRAFT_507418 [Polyplosphaeria fusca]
MLARAITWAEHVYNSMILIVDLVHADALIIAVINLSLSGVLGMVHYLNSVPKFMTTLKLQHNSFDPR